MAVPIYSQNLTVQSSIALLPHSIYSPILPKSIPLPPDFIDIDDTRLCEMEHSLVADGDEEDTYQNLTDILVE
jgi:hypothetical protein